MNTLELHILRRLAKVSPDSLESFDNVEHTIALMLDNDLIRQAGVARARYTITAKGKSKLESRANANG